MSLGSWQPQIHRLEARWLEEFIALGRQEPLPDLNAALDDDLRHRGALMALTEPAWLEAVQDFDRAEIVALMRFLVVAEATLPGWEAGAGSPVIYLNHLLKRRETPLDQDELRWIKAHTSNRFLPNGPL
ncbi:MAG TPA: hypothetical protein VL027_04500 [Spongiibacteraceae bacterium]|jgi:hypothetical protein|nr:hypothetical protein [Spongiibacteraceae bacterium]HUH37189.1 hypothetical protein [Spongiibacteraceae bacterium]